VRFQTLRSTSDKHAGTDFTDYTKLVFLCWKLICGHSIRWQTCCWQSTEKGNNSWIIHQKDV